MLLCIRKFETSLEDFAQALAYDSTDHVVELNPNEVLCYSNRSFSRLKTGDLAGAMKDINISLSLYKTNSYAYKVRGLIYLEKNMNSAACQDFNEALRLGYTEEHGGEVRELIKEHCD